MTVMKVENRIPPTHLIAQDRDTDMTFFVKTRVIDLCRKSNLMDKTMGARFNGNSYVRRSIWGGNDDVRKEA